ncbi:MAG: hypothetical protein ABR964_16350 [Tepidisphaeraceae bacterium]|jgi:hypothetical protein
MEALQIHDIARNATNPDAPAVEAARADLGPLRERAGRLLQTGLEAIDRALSRDAEAFLSASRQRGGQ